MRALESLFPRNRKARSVATGEKLSLTMLAPRPDRPCRVNHEPRRQPVPFVSLGLARFRSRAAIRHSANNSGPAARWIAPSTPPPPSREVLAAFTIASTASVVMSSCRISMRSQTGVIGRSLLAVEIFHLHRVVARSGDGTGGNRRFDLGNLVRVESSPPARRALLQLRPRARADDRKNKASFMQIPTQWPVATAKCLSPQQSRAAWRQASRCGSGSRRQSAGAARENRPRP